MLERTLVPQSPTRAAAHRTLAQGIQRRATKERTGWADPLPIRTTEQRGIKYSNRRTLDQNATQEGVTPTRYLLPKQEIVRARLKKFSLRRPNREATPWRNICGPNGPASWETGKGGECATACETTPAAEPFHGGRFCRREDACGRLCGQLS